MTNTTAQNSTSTGVNASLGTIEGLVVAGVGGLIAKGAESGSSIPYETSRGKSYSSSEEAPKTSDIHAIALPHPSALAFEGLKPNQPETSILARNSMDPRTISDSLNEVLGHGGIEFSVDNRPEPSEENGWYEAKFLEYNTTTNASFVESGNVTPAIGGGNQDAIFKNILPVAAGIILGIGTVAFLGYKAAKFWFKPSAGKESENFEDQPIINSHSEGYGTMAYSNVNDEQVLLASAMNPLGDNTHASSHDMF